ncbi:MAG: M3 family oligoendopeptidase [Planctomycetota bacterium]|nr:M3 family oligoendopeptidase [Planctomycetota bacterium]
MTQVDFHAIPVQTPDPEAVATRYGEITQAFESAEDAAGRAKAIERWDDLRRELQTWGAMVGLRFQQDTRDEQRKAALTERDEMSPKFAELEIALMRTMRDSEHASEIAERFGQHVLDVWDTSIASYDPAIEQETIAESKGSASYTELVSSASFEFRGETLNLSQLQKYATHADRQVRHDAAKLRWGWFQENAERLDEIFHELVGLRAKQAGKLDYPTYVELGYRRMGRVDYDQKDVERYRKEVREHVVPLCSRIREQQRVSLGVDTLMAWDEAVYDELGAPKPKGDHDWMVERAHEMFGEMGSGLGEFFQLMDGGSLLDLKAREGKAGGGFCTSFPTHGVPYIFANFNGTKGDVLVFTHEMGHAFQCYSSREQKPVDYLWPTADGAEVHSMSLEFLTWPHMEKFFGDDAERFRRTHLTDSLLFLPYGVAVDHFQHLVYENPTASAAERLGMWQEMERMYLPWRNWGDLERPAAGGFWQGQLHIYHYPFYYIDYTLAGVCAMQFWVKAEKDREQAMVDYVALCKRGGEAPFQDLVRSAGLTSPFDEGCLTEVVAQAGETLGL